MRHIFIASLVLASATVLPACEQKTVDVSGGADPLGWTSLIEFDQQTDARAVWGSGPNDVYAGYENPESYLRHFDGTEWKDVHLASSVRSVRDIWSSGPDDVFVTTYDDIWHFDGNDWTPGGIPAYRIEGHDAGHVIAMDSRMLARFDGAEWDTLLVIPEYYRIISSCWIGAGDSVLVTLHSLNSDSLIWHDGVAWSAPEVAPGLIADFVGSTADDLVAVGGDSNFNGRVWRWDGDQWTDLSAPTGNRLIYAAFGEGTNDFYVAGCDILHYTGSGWETLPTASNEDCFHDLWASGDADIYAAGRNVQRFNGAVWSPVVEVTPDRVHVVWAESRSRVVVAGRFSVFRFENGIWTEEGRDSLQLGIDAIEGRSWNDLYAATWRGVFHNDGTGWKSMPDSPGEVRKLFPLPTGEVFAADYTRIFRYDAQAWTVILDLSNDPGPKLIESLWAFGANDVLAGDQNGLRRFDGVSWKRIDDVASFDLLAFSPDDIYSLGPEQLRHSNGGPFESVGPHFAATRVAGTSPDHIVVTSRRGTYAAYYHGQWIVGTEPNSYNLDLTAAADGSIVRLDVLSETRYGIWYHRE